MSTDGNLPDLRFPQTGGHGNAIHLSANTLKQHGRNGETTFSEPEPEPEAAFAGCPLLPPASHSAPMAALSYDPRRCPLLGQTQYSPFF